jgi:hypothetical protein
MEDHDALNCCRDPDEKVFRRQRLIDDCWLHDKRLADWHKTKPPAGEDSLRIPEASETLKPEDLTEAHIMTLYWATCIILYREMSGILGSDAILPEHAKANTCCRSIIQTIPIFIHPSVGTFRTHLMTFPMHLAMIYLRDFTPKDEMVVERELLASYFKKSEAATMGKFIHSLGTKLSEIK